jgi:flagellar hook-associated protein 1 FlgK
LNKQITISEATTGGSANDLRDLRQQKLESLAKLVNFQSSSSADGAVNITVSGDLLVSDSTVQDKLQTFDPGSGQLQISSASTGTPLTLSGGSIQGTIEVRDGGIAALKSGLNNLASQLISTVNTVYQVGFDLNGNTGAALFTGTDASNIGVNPTLANDPSQFQAAGVSGNAGDNQTVLALAQLGSTSLSALSNQTFSQSYATTATTLGAALSTINGQLSDQQVIQTALQTQQSSVSGVSIDDEMTNLMQFQRAYEASAELVSTLNTMLGEVVNNLKQQ